jgi:hypothetical protein
MLVGGNVVWWGEGWSGVANIPENHAYHMGRSLTTPDPQLARLLSRIALSQILIIVFAVLVLASMPMFILIGSSQTG